MIRSLFKRSRAQSRTVSILAVGVTCVVFASLVTAQSEKSGYSSTMIKRGKMLVDFGDCTACHTPWLMTPRGPRPDSTKYLSGHPAGMLDPAPALPFPWMAATTHSMTAWAGPWGISYSSNLTPDSSGLGIWTEEMFIKAIRTGKHFGVSRPIMPPMPIEAIRTLPDEDLKAIFAYLRTIKPIPNVVPDYAPPTTE